MEVLAAVSGLTGAAKSVRAVLSEGLEAGNARPSAAKARRKRKRFRNPSTIAVRRILSSGHSFLLSITWMSASSHLRTVANFSYGDWRAQLAVCFGDKVA